jgi:RHS repeat-associated protein
MAKTYFLWDTREDNIVQELDGACATVAEYTTEPALYGNVISQWRSGQSGFFHFDSPGSTLAVTDGGQNITDTRSYSAWGEAAESAGNSVFPFRFLGRVGYYDSQMALIYVRRRHYAAVRGRWTSTDPLRFKDDLHNLYRYVKNRPLFDVDPSGEAIQVTLAALLIATACAAGCIGCYVNVKDIHGQGNTFGRNLCTVISCGTCAACIVAVCSTFTAITCVLTILSGTVTVLLLEE